MPTEVPNGTILARGFDWERVQFQRRRIGECVSLAYGRSLVESHRKPGNVQIYGTNGPCGWHDTPLSVSPGVVLGRKGQGHLGVRWVTEPFWVIDTAYYAVADSAEVDLRWFYYITRYVGLDHLKTGEKPGLSRDIFGRQLFPFPSIDEQRAISRVLGAFDDKIEQNRRVNRILGEMASALFCSWFVDFDPVVSKAAGRKPAGLAPELAALFPDAFTESRLGPIPRGWTIGAVGDLCSILRTGINPGDSPTEIFDHYSIPAFDEGEWPALDVGRAIRSNKFVVPKDCVLLSKLNPHTPRVWLPDVSAERRSVCSTEFMVVEPKAGYTREYLKALFCSDVFSSEFATFATGTSNSHQRVRPESLSGMPALIPGPKLVDAFTKLAAPWFGCLAQNRRQSRTLAALRDAILPKVLSGELRVREAEKQVVAIV